MGTPSTASPHRRQATGPDLYEPVSATMGGSPLAVDDPVQYLPPASQTLTYDLDGNMLTDGRWTYTWDAADRLIRMESAAWTQPAGSGTPAATVPARLIEFGYDASSRRIRKKVHEKAYGASSWTLVTWEAYVYDGWNQTGRYTLTPASAPAAYAGTAGGVVQSRHSTPVWGPDLASPLDARTDWQQAGGVNGLLMVMYPKPGGATASFGGFMDAQYSSSVEAGHWDAGLNAFVWYSGPGTPPTYDQNGNWVEYHAGWWTDYYGFLPYYTALGYYGDAYASTLYQNCDVHVPMSDEMGNVTGVTRLRGLPGLPAETTPELVFDYDAFGRELRASSLVSGVEPDNFPWRFSTKFTDPETSLCYYGYRYYDPNKGRWLGRDPIREEGGVNFYGMVENNTVGIFDILGWQAPEEWHHIYPKNHKANFKIVDIDIDAAENGIILPKEIHRAQGAITSDYTKDWNKFWKDNPDATREEVEAFREKMDEKYKDAYSKGRKTNERFNEYHNRKRREKLRQCKNGAALLSAGGKFLAASEISQEFTDAALELCSMDKCMRGQDQWFEAIARLKLAMNDMGIPELAQNPILDAAIK